MRTADTEQKDLSKAEVFRPVLLCELLLDSGAVYVCSLDKNIIWNGNTYLGVGDLGKVSVGGETVSSGAVGLTLELSGIPANYVSIAANEDYHGRTVILRYGFMDSNFKITGATGNPAILFQGIIDQMFIKLGKEAVINLTAEDDWIRWEEPIKSLYTNEEQQFLFPGDLGLEFVAQTVDKEIIWGRT